MGTDPFIPVYDWMLALPIHGSEILLYAIIYSFSSAAGSFTGSQQYLARRAKLSRSNLSAALGRLENKRLIRKTDHYKNGVKYCEYQIDRETLARLRREQEAPCPETEQDVPKQDAPCPETGHRNVLKQDNPRPETGHNKKEYNKEINKEDKKEGGNPPVSSSSVRKAYGDYHNVLLSDEELTELKREFPDDYRERIGRLSEYMASTGKRYHNHSATIRVWAKRDGRAQEPPAPETERERQMAEVLKVMEKKGLTL